MVMGRENTGMCRCCLGRTVTLLIGGVEVANVMAFDEVMNHGFAFFSFT
jgi:hypothetical protein